MMDLQLKQRIIGGIVIVCVLAIFLPILLHRPQPIVEKSLPMQIPKPDAPVSEMSLQLPVTQVAPAPRVAPQKVLVTARPAQKAAPAAHKALNKQILQAAITPPKAWVVQLASFSSEKNATLLVAKLRASGFDAYTRTSAVHHKLITRVFVGPEIHQDRMVHIQKQLNQQFHLKGVVRKYHV